MVDTGNHDDAKTRRRRSKILRRWCFGAAAWATIAGSPPAAASLTESARLAAVYDAILDARFDRIEAQLKETCPPAPWEACQALTAAGVWWQILIHPESRLLDGRLNDVAEAAIAANAAWTRREPERGEAWFYLAGSYGPLVQWRILRGERLAAAREGKKIKDALERALRLDPTLSDAYFGIGLYRYYADVAPAYAKLLRWLLLLPGGDRAAGLREMIQAREHGELLTGEADYQLHQIYLWYEHRPIDALRLLQTLDAHHPSNPLFLQRIAETEDVHLHDSRASADAWQALLERAQGGRVYGARLAEVRARLGLASALAAMDDTERAIEQLQIVIDSHPIAPAGARVRAEQQLREVRARHAKK